MQQVLHHVRDAVVSGNTFDVPLNSLEHIDLRHLVNIATMTVTYELPSYPVLVTGIFASKFNGNKRTA